MAEAAPATPLTTPMTPTLSGDSSGDEQMDEEGLVVEMPRCKSVWVDGKRRAVVDEGSDEAAAAPPAPASGR